MIKKLALMSVLLAPMFARPNVAPTIAEKAERFVTYFLTQSSAEQEKMMIVFSIPLGPDFREVFNGIISRKIIGGSDAEDWHTDSDLLQSLADLSKPIAGMEQLSTEAIRLRAKADQLGTLVNYSLAERRDSQNYSFYFSIKNPALIRAWPLMLRVGDPGSAKVRYVVLSSDTLCVTGPGMGLLTFNINPQKINDFAQELNREILELRKKVAALNLAQRMGDFQDNWSAKFTAQYRKKNAHEVLDRLSGNASPSEKNQFVDRMILMNPEQAEYLR